MSAGLPCILDPVEQDQDADEIFDQELTDVLATYGQELEELSRVLVATGTGSITGPFVALRVTLQVPRRWRGGLLEIAALDPASRAVIGGSAMRLSRQHPDSASLIREIIIHVGMALAHGDFSAGPR
jgi:hypothetical protein